MLVSLRTAIATLLVTLCVSSVAACSRDGRGDVSPSVASESSSTPSATPDAETSAGPSISASTIPSPAGGTPVELDVVSLVFPDGWEVERSNDSGARAFQTTEDTLGQVVVSTTPAIGEADLESYARAATQVNRKNGLDLVRAPDRDVAGVTGYVLTGTDTIGDAYFEFGALHAERVVRVVVTYRPGATEAAGFEARVTEPLLASITWSDSPAP